jgi:ParB-like chromosome segregation protein Spo0J
MTAPENLANRAKTTADPDEAIQKTLAEDARRRDEQRNKFEYSFHSRAAIFPLMEDDELDELGKNIAANGLLEPITIKDKMIVDGRNRYRACKRTDHKFSEEDFVELPSDVDLLSFVISKNIVRRHLTAEQKREVIAVLLKENPNASSRAIAGLARVSHHTVEAVREATGQSAQKRTGRDGKKRKAPAKKRGPSPKQKRTRSRALKKIGKP